MFQLGIFLARGPLHATQILRHMHLPFHLAYFAFFSSEHGFFFLLHALADHGLVGKRLYFNLEARHGHFGRVKFGWHRSRRIAILLQVQRCGDALRYVHAFVYKAVAAALVELIETAIAYLTARLHLQHVFIEVVSACDGSAGGCLQNGVVALCLLEVVVAVSVEVHVEHAQVRLLSAAPTFL